MYNIVYVDENGKIIVIDRDVSKIVISNDYKDIEIVKNGSTEVKYGCDKDRYFIFNDEMTFLEGGLITNSIIDAQVSKDTFLYVEPEKVIEVQSEYIRMLEQKIKELG